MTWSCLELGRIRVVLVAALALSRAVSVDVPGTTDSGKVAVDRAAAKKVTTSWDLPRHSFKRTLSYDDNLGSWLQSGATMALRDRVTLIPEVSDRYGMLWHTEPINTSSFHVRFQMALNLTEKHKQQDLLSTDSHLTFWMSPDNLVEDYNENKIVQSKDWKTGLEELGLSFRGNKPTFRGLMVSFGIGSESGKATPGVTVGWNTGVDYRDSRAAKLLETFTPIEWRGMPFVELAVRVQLPNVISVMLRLQDTEKSIFSLGTAHGVVSGWDGTHVGFTAYSGSDITAEANIRMVEAVNFDPTKVGEVASGARSADVMAIEAWEEILRSEKRHMSQKSQAEALARLTELLEQHIDHMSELGGEVQAKFVELGSRLDMMETHLGQTLAGLEAFNVDAGTMDISAVNQHVVGLKQAFVKLGRLHDGAVHKMQEATLKLKPELSNPTLKKDRQVMVKAASDQVIVLEEQVSKSSAQTGWMILCLMACVSGLGMLFLWRMRYYEKKHFI